MGALGTSVAKILGSGSIGLGFLLAFLAYRLLHANQKNPAADKHVAATYVFMGFSALLVAAGSYLEVTRQGSDGLRKALADKDQALEAARHELALRPSLAARAEAAEAENARLRAEVATLSKEAWLLVGGLRGVDGRHVRLVVAVNGQHTLAIPADMPFAKAGPEMGLRAIRLPPAAAYQLKFTVQVDDPKGRYPDSFTHAQPIMTTGAGLAEQEIRVYKITANGLWTPADKVSAERFEPSNPRQVAIRFAVSGCPTPTC